MSDEAPTTTSAASRATTLDGVTPDHIRALRSRDGGAAVTRGTRVAVAVPDATRPIDIPLIVAPLIESLAEVGARPSLIVALGLHRKLRPVELEPIAAIARRFNLELAEHD